MGTGLPGVRHWGVKQLALREESGFFDGDLLDILILRHIAKSYNKGKKCCQEQPHKEVSHSIFLISRKLKSDAIAERSPMEASGFFARLLLLYCCLPVLTCHSLFRAILFQRQGSGSINVQHL